MALPITIPNTFANATTSIPLSQLDNNFSTVVVAINGIGNGAEALANVNITGGTVANVNLSTSNVNITGGNVAVTTVDATNVEVTNIKAKDGTAAVVISDSSGNVNFDSNTLFVDATNNNVGVGTTPQTKLHVNGGAIRHSNTNGILELANGNTAGGTKLSSYNATLTNNGYLAFEGYSIEYGRFDSSGNLLVGTNTATNNIRLQAKLAVVSAGNNTYGGGMFTTYSGTSVGAGSFLDLTRSRGTTDGSMTKVESGDTLGYIVFRGSDGSSFQNAAQIQADVDGATGANDVPGRLLFSTTPDGSTSPVERMRITSDGYLRMASGTGGIQFNGDTAAGNALDDYESGTTDLVFRLGSTELNRQTNGLRYIKIGAFVFICCDNGGDGFSKGANSGDLRIDLPFTVAGGINSTGTVRYNGFNPSAGTITIVSMASSGATYALFQMFSTGGYLGNISNSTLDASATIYDFTLCYYTTA